MDDFSLATTYLACATPFLVGPLTIGLLILVRYRHDRAAIAVGWFTLKPVWSALIYTASLALALVTIDENRITLVAVVIFQLPSVALTLVLVIGFRSLVSRSKLLASILLLDLVRWLLGFWLHPLWVARPGLIFLCDSIVQLAPTAYALIALAIVRKYVAHRARL